MSHLAQLLIVCGDDQRGAQVVGDDPERAGALAVEPNRVDLERRADALEQQCQLWLQRLSYRR